MEGGSSFLPCLFHEDLEAVRTGGGDGQVQAVTAHAPDDGRGVHVLIRYLPRQQLPQNHPERPAREKETDTENHT